MKRLGLAGRFRIVTVPWDATQLARLRSALEAKLSPASVGIAGDHVSVLTQGAPTSAEKETISGSREALAASDGIAEAPPVEMGELAGTPGSAAGSVTCGKYGNASANGYCNTLVAGDRWFDSAGSCTMAWWVSIKEREPKEFPSILTAGHCIAPVGTVAGTYTCEPEGTSCGQFGLTLTYYEGEGRGDAGLIDYYSGLYGAPTFPLVAGYWNWWDSGLSPLEYYRLVPPSKGTMVCLQGYRTGSSCGEVTRIEQTELNGSDGATDSNMIEVKLSSGSDCKGDSGAPWDLASKDTAVGINDLVLFNEGAECGNVAWLTPVEEPINDWGLIMWGHDAWHEPW